MRFSMTLPLLLLLCCGGCSVIEDDIAFFEDAGDAAMTDAQSAVDGQADLVATDAVSDGGG